MSGYPDLNFPAFDRAKAKLIAEGHTVVSPADLDRTRGQMPYEAMLRDDLRYLLECDAIYMLRSWETSNGAKLEKYVAEKLLFKVLYEGR